MNHPALPLFTHLVALASLLAVTTAHAAVFTVGPPGNNASCTHTTIQAAIDAAAASPGLDIIRLATGVYPAQRVVVNDANDLAIEGGFLECATLVHVDFSTLDGQGASPTGPVILHQGSGRLTLADLHVLNGVAYGAGATTTVGGGVSSIGPGNLTVYRSMIAGNRARIGGGMMAHTSASVSKVVTLDDVAFYNNEAEESGGGLAANGVTVEITGSGTFAGNHADGTNSHAGGGALYALNSSVFVDIRPLPSAAFMDNNWAESDGGAIYFENLASGSRVLVIKNSDEGLPPSLTYNTADRFGGAIFVGADAPGSNNSAHVNLINAIVAENRASEGGAFYVYANGESSTPDEASLSMSASVVPGGNARSPAGLTQPCPAAQRCNRVEHNISTQGATIVLYEDGSGGAASFSMERGHLVDNIAINGGGLVYGNGGVFIDNSVLANNDAGNSSLIDNAGGNLIQVRNSTIANNTRVAPALFTLISASDTLLLHNSIAYQPGVPMYHIAAGSTVDLRNLLVGSGHGLVNTYPRNIHDNLDPHFVNPGQNDFRLQPGSQARNRWEPGGGVNVPDVDLLGAIRPAPPVGPTPYDFGAYEYGAVVDQIFYSPFDRF